MNTMRDVRVTRILRLLEEVTQGMRTLQSSLNEYAALGVPLEPEHVRRTANILRDEADAFELGLATLRQALLTTEEA